MQTTTKYDFLDGLRGLAIIFVLLSHIHYTGYNIGDAFHIGLIGVPLFFMVSSYTLALSQDKKGCEAGWMKQFFLRRFFRIYPLYFMIITIIFLLGSFDIINDWENFNQGIYSRNNLLSHLSFTNGFFPNFMNSFRLGEWSLFNEIIFYSLFPLIFPYIQKGKKELIIAILSSVMIYGGRNILAQQFSLDPTYIYHFVSYHRIDFSLGFLLFYFHKYHHTLALSNSTKNIFSVVSILFFLILSYLYTQGYYINHIIWLIALCSICSSAIVSKTIKKIFSNTILTYMGKISYSLYLLNLPILCAIGYFNPFPNDPIYNFLLALSLLILIASITFRFENYRILKGRKF